MERIQVNLPRSLRKVLRQLQYLYRNTFPDFLRDGNKRVTANNTPKILLQPQDLVRSYGTEAGVEGLRERNKEKAKGRMRKKREGGVEEGGGCEIV